ncbi:MAG: hypothetical protein KBG15_21770 [Kofleriaceae bacterium]|nr:hypothetical protein [Kofleriaceae bacterium]
MKSSLRRCIELGLLGATLLGMNACGHTSASAPQPERGSTAQETPTAATPTPPAAGASTAAITAVDVFYNAMTDVMDTPNNQQRLAEEAVKNSNLVAELKSMGLTVNVLHNGAVGDEVVVKAADGTELGRAALHDIERKNTPAAMLDKISAAIGARK